MSWLVPVIEKDANSLILELYVLLYSIKIMFFPGSPAVPFSCVCNEVSQNVNTDSQEQYVEAKMPEEPRRITLKTSKHRKK